MSALSFQKLNHQRIMDIFMQIDEIGQDVGKKRANT
jgi:hypothetical protein